MNQPLSIEMNNYTINFKDQEAARTFVMWYSHHAKLVSELALLNAESDHTCDETTVSLALLQRELNYLINQASSFIC